jgi:hypothetical protein
MHVWQGNLVSSQKDQIEIKKQRSNELAGQSFSWTFYILNFIALIQIILIVLWLHSERKKRRNVMGGNTVI